MKTPSTEQLVSEAVTWAHLHGLIMNQGDGVKDVSVIHAPFALLPTPFPAGEFALVQRIMPAFSELVHTISMDAAYLTGTLAQAAQFDDFTARLLRVYRECAAARDRFASPIALGLHRSDYMLDAPSDSLLQVELNTIASSFGSLSTLVSAMHSDLLARHPGACDVAPEQLPAQDALNGFAAALAGAHAAHGELHPEAAAGSVVVMVVQPGERNAYDQQWLQAALWERHGVRVVRRSLADIGAAAEVTQAGALRLDGATVSVVYFRAGYTPDDYPSDTEWRARTLVESSDAVSCPSVAYQLAGAKKIQQDLAAPGQLERFVKDAEDVRALRSCFAGLWSLDDVHAPETRAVMDAAIATPDDYVLKPQREGGGNNLYGDELVAKLEAGKGLASYILMQRIRPPVKRSILVRKGEHFEGDTLSELGIYGAYLRVRGDVRTNACVGHLLRTKIASSNEGGVAAGFAVLDSPYIV